jgi:hypothetical protein
MNRDIYEMAVGLTVVAESAGRWGPATSPIGAAAPGFLAAR